MTIRIETGPGARCRAIVDGSMTIYEAASDKSALLDAVARAQEAEIDLSSVSEIDTAGLQVLILAKRESLKAGKVLRLTGHSPASLDVLERYGLAAYFGCGDDNGVPCAASSTAGRQAATPRRNKRRRQTRAKAK